MKKRLIQILFKLIGDDVFEIAPKYYEKMNDWLYDSYGHAGFQQYYTLRKKFITSAMGTEMDRKTYLKHVGRLEELAALKENIEQEISRRKKKEEALKKQHSVTE